jgi:DnaJ-class molecular chaperone
MAAAAHDPGACPPCRGTGKVISMTDGTRRELTCPWCGGTGRRPSAEPGPASG